MRAFVHIVVLLVPFLVASPARCQRYNSPAEGAPGISGYQIVHGKSGESVQGEVMEAVKAYIQTQISSAGFLTVSDPLTGRNRRLIFMKLERNTRRENDRYAVRGIFRDADNGEVLGVDIYAQPSSGKMSVIGLLIKEAGGRKRSKEETGKLNAD